MREREGGQRSGQVSYQLGELVLAPVFYVSGEGEKGQEGGEGRSRGRERDKKAESQVGGEGKTACDRTS